MGIRKFVHSVVLGLSCAVFCVFFSYADDSLQNIQRGQEELEERFHASERGRSSHQEQEPVITQEQDTEEEPRAAPTQERQRTRQLYRTRQPSSISQIRGAMQVEDYRAESSMNWPLLRESLSLGVRGGLVSGLNILAGPSIPYATLKPSPYMTFRVSSRHRGEHLDTTAAITAGYLGLQTQQSLNLGDPPLDDLSENVATGSFYGDVIGTWRLAKAMGLSVFAGASGWRLQTSQMGNQGFVDGNVGTTLAIRASDSDVIRGWFQTEATLHKPDSFRNVTSSGWPNLSLFLEGVHTGIDWQRRFDPSTSLRVWSEYSEREPYQRLETGVDYTQDQVSLSAFSRYQDTQSPWFVDEAGGGARVEWRALSGLGLGVTGFGMTRRDYTGVDLPAGYGVLGSLSWTPGQNEDRFEARRHLARRTMDNPQRERIRAQADSYSAIPPEVSSRFYDTLHNSENFAAFIDNLAPSISSSQDIIQAVSLLTETQSTLSYNYSEEEGVPNVGTTEELYTRWRSSHINNQPDPILVCIGSAQIGAELAIALGERAGIPIVANSPHLTRRGPDGKHVGHAAAMIRTPDAGFFFVDWGEIIPTNTYDPQAALAIYQAQQGTFSAIHAFTDPARRGRYAGRVITEQGRVVLDATTFFGEPGFQTPRTRGLFAEDRRGSGTTLDRGLEASERILR